MRTFSGPFDTPIWTSATRPSNPGLGVNGFNSDLLTEEFWNGSGWAPVGGRSINNQTPLNNFFITMVGNNEILNLTPSGTLASGTVQMPPLSGSESAAVTIKTSQTIQSITFTANVGQSVANPPTLLPAGSQVDATFDVANATWYFSALSANSGSVLVATGAMTFGSKFTTITLPTGYRLFQFIFNRWEFSADAFPCFQTSEDGGITWWQNTNQYSEAYTGAGGNYITYSTGTNSAFGFVACWSGSPGTLGANGSMLIDPGGGGACFSAESQFGGYFSGAKDFMVSSVRLLASSNRQNSIRFFDVVGNNWTNGNYWLTGIF